MPLVLILNIITTDPKYCLADPRFNERGFQLWCSYQADLSSSLELESQFSTPALLNLTGPPQV